MAMTVPGGSRRKKRNGALDGDPRGAEFSHGVHELADASADSEVGRGEEQGNHVIHYAGEGEAPSGVWLALGDGAVLFHPVSATAAPGRCWPEFETGSVEEADDQTLDAASRLMPLLSREFIAETLRLGPYRSGGDAT
jgi:hypothetical protein